MSSTGLKFSDLTTLGTSSLNLSAIIPVVQDNQNYSVAINDIKDDNSLLQATSATWNDNTSVVQSNSATWSVDTVYDDSLIQSSSATWDDTSSAVQSNSATWANLTDSYDDSLLQSTSATWDDTSSTVLANSASWSVDTDTLYDDSLLQATSGNWDDTYTTVGTNSASWDTPDTTPKLGSISSNVATISSYSSTLHLTEDVYSINWSDFTDLSLGDSGLIIITQDGNGPWTFFGGNPDDKYLAGDTADIAAMVAGDTCTVGWFYPSVSISVPGNAPRMYYYVSDVAN